MNYIEQFLKDNNLAIGQKFRPKKSNCDIWFDDTLVMQGTSNGCKVIFLTEIMTGEFEFADELPKRWRAEYEEFCPQCSAEMNAEVYK